MKFKLSENFINKYAVDNDIWDKAPQYKSNERIKSELDVMQNNFKSLEIDLNNSKYEDQLKNINDNFLIYNI